MWLCLLTKHTSFNVNLSNKQQAKAVSVEMMDHYKVLGLNRNATKLEIKEAFRKLALKFHPDKHSDSSKHVKDGATLKFKQISEAYGVLIDDRKRADYNLRSSTTAGGHGGSGYGGGGGYGGGYHSGRTNGGNYYYGSKYKTTASSSSAGTRGFDFQVALRFLTTRSFLLNLAFVSILLGGSILIERSGENLWKMQNSGKSFEEAMESIDKTKKQKEKR